MFRLVIFIFDLLLLLFVCLSVRLNCHNEIDQDVMNIINPSVGHQLINTRLTVDSSVDNYVLECVLLTRYCLHAWCPTDIESDRD